VRSNQSGLPAGETDEMKTSASHEERVTTAPDDDRGRAGRGQRRSWLIALAVCALAIVVITAFFLRSPALDKPLPVASAPTASAIAQVSIRNIQFSPAALEVKKGDVVEWKNDDLVPHTATSSSFDSRALAPGQSWRHTFTAAGTFPYVCTFHPNMKGVVTVK
jgi:plastocyanin